MSKKKVAEEVSYPEFGFFSTDEDGIALSVKSNVGMDRGKYLEHAKKSKRPICISIEGEIFDTYKFRNFALTKDEARNLIKELTVMLDYLDE